MRSPERAKIAERTPAGVEELNGLRNLKTKVTAQWLPVESTKPGAISGLWQIESKWIQPFNHACACIVDPVLVEMNRRMKWIS